MQPKKLNVFDFTMLITSMVIGMGIFRTPVNVAKSSASPLLFYGVWVLGGIVAICGALTYAEIGSRLPVTGGYYKVFSYAYHPSIAFGVNCIILVSNCAAMGGVALVGGEYITGILMPESRNAEWMKVAANENYISNIHNIIAIIAILLFYAINMLGLKMSARTQNILMIIKISMIVLLITPLFFDNGASLPSVAAEKVDPLFIEYVKAFGTALVAVSFTYGGYQQTINFGTEVKEPRKNIPRAVFYGITIIIGLYLTVNYAYVNVIGFEQLKTSKNIAAIMAGKIFGEDAERILSVLLFLSVLAFVNIQLMSNPRVMEAMSEDRILPAAFGKRNRKTNAPVVSLTAFALLAILVVFWAKEFDTILSFSIFLDCFGMALSAGSIFILRKRTKHLDDTGIYTMKWFPLMPVLFISCYVFVGIILAITETDLALLGLGVLITFIGIYFLVNRIQQNKANASK